MVTEATPLPLPRDMAADQAADPAATRRLEALFAAHFDFVWRSLRRLGVADSGVDDATQEVFLVAQRKLAAIEAGKEKAFLFGTALRVASDLRRSQRRRPSAEAESDRPDTSHPPIDELVDRKRARELLDEIVAELPEDARPVFVLFELEGMTMAEIATCLDLKPGTVASRLRRAREMFTAALARREAARRTHG
jgi:RNA polymerase sigma-70 factor (ECF subfamily)